MNLKSGAAFALDLSNVIPSTAAGRFEFMNQMLALSWDLEPWWFKLWLKIRGKDLQYRKDTFLWAFSSGKIKIGPVTYLMFNVTGGDNEHG